MLDKLLKWHDQGAEKIKRGSTALSKLYEGDRGINDLAENDAELRLWLSAPLKLAMSECTAEMRTTTARYLREFLVVYLYGAHELLRMQYEKSGLYYVPPPRPRSEQALFSRAHAVDYIPGLGKNIVPIKLYLHKKMKADLETLAVASGIPLGQFVREILVSHFLGHMVWPERVRIWTDEQQKIADDWEADLIKEHCVDEPSAEEEATLEGKVEHILW